MYRHEAMTRKGMCFPIYTFASIVLNDEQFDRDNWVSHIEDSCLKDSRNKQIWINEGFCEYHSKWQFTNYFRRLVFIHFFFFNLIQILLSVYKGGTLDVLFNVVRLAHVQVWDHKKEPGNDDQYGTCDIQPWVGNIPWSLELIIGQMPNCDNLFI